MCLRLFFLGVELFEQFQLFGQQLRLLRVVDVAAHSVVFVEDHVAALAGLQVDDPGEEADFVVGVQILPQAVGEVADGAGAGEAERLPLKAGDGIAIVLVGADEVAFTGHGLGVVEEIALDALAVAVGRLEDAHLVASVCVHHSGDAGGVVGAVRLKGAGAQGVGKTLAWQQDRLLTV